MNLIRNCCLSLGLLVLVSLSRARGESILWYNGDYAGGSGTVNENSMSAVYEDFEVTVSGGWMVQRLWSNDCMQFQGVTSAIWSIRTGMSAGNGGTIVASGTSAASQTPTGRTAWWGFPEYTIEVSGLNIYLGPGTYWLSVAPLVGNDPVSSGYYRSYISQTWGANAIGIPPGNDANSFWNWPSAGYNFALHPFNEDFSMGVAGVVIPEPSTCVLSMLCGIFVCLSRAGRRELQPPNRALQATAAAPGS